MKRIISNVKSKYSNEILRKITRLEQMNEVIKCMNNEDCYYEWIYLVPDQANRDDFEFIAMDESLYNEVCDLYDKLYLKYSEDGLYKPSATAFNYAKSTDKRLHLKDIEVFY